MKLSKVALSVAVLVGVGVVGGSWYTGKQIESNYQQVVDYAQKQVKQLAQYGIEIEIKDVQVERHLFSSDFKYRFEGSFIDEKFELVGNDTIYHGPFPFNRVKQGNLMPLMASFESHLTSPEQLKAVFGEKMTHAVFDVSYSGAGKGELRINALDHSSENGRLVMSPITINYENDKAKNSKTTVVLDKLHLNGTNGAVFHLDGVNYAASLVDNQGYPYLGLGDGKITVKELKWQDEGASSTEGLKESEKGFSLQNIQGTWNNSLNGTRTLQSGQTEIGNMQFGRVSLGKSKIDVSLDLDAKLANDSMPYFSNTEQLETAEAGDAILRLLNQLPKFHINHLSFEREGGKIQGALHLNIGQVDFSQIQDMSGFVKALTKSDLSIEVSKGYLMDVSRQVAMYSDNLGEEEANIRAEQMAKEIFAGAMGSNFAVVENETIKLNLHVEDGKIMLNGKEMQENDLQMIMFMLMMGAASH